MSTSQQVNKVKFTKKLKIVPLISRQRIRKKVKELAGRISRDYKKKRPILLCVLKGALIFTADLVGFLKIPVDIDFAWPSSYAGDQKSSGRIKFKYGPQPALKGRDVIIVEDIIDTGLTLGVLKSKLNSLGAKSIRVCCLLDKKARRIKKVILDYKGFGVPDKFLVGYGLDLADKYRNLPYIGYIK